MIKSYCSKLGILQSYHSSMLYIEWGMGKCSHKDLNREDRSYKLVYSLLPNQLIILQTSLEYISRQEITPLESPSLGFESQLQSKHIAGQNQTRVRKWGFDPR